MDTTKLGRQGEEAAAVFLKEAGYEILARIFARRAGKSTSWPALSRPWPSLKSRRGARGASVGQRPLSITGNNRKSSSLRAGSCGRDISTVVSVVLMSLRSASQGSAGKSITCPARLRRERFAGCLPSRAEKRNGRRVVEIGGIAIVCKIIGGTTMGVDGLIIAVEVDSAAGLPAFDIVGLPDTAVRESKERVRTAIRNSGIQLRQEKVTINLARPASARTVPASTCQSPSASSQRTALCRRTQSRRRSLQQSSPWKGSAAQCMASCRWSSPRERRG